MKTNTRWEEAQQTEMEFWHGMVQVDHGVLRVLADNSEKAPLLKNQLTRTPQSCLEVGTGPFGLGVIGFLPEIPFRIAMDPLPPARMDSNDLLRQYVMQRRSTVSYLVACGEDIPIRNDSLELVICCNVVDHASDPDAILEEIHRILKPGGLFFFDVDTFSALGLVKWHCWTKYKHKAEIVVRAHPHRMFETTVRRKLESHGFELQKLTGHTFLSAWIGHARTSSFLGAKRPK